jgi:lipoic acid synthetase
LSAPSQKPDWLRVRVPYGENWRRVSAAVEGRGLHTVCDSARCPNKAECWGAATATFMVLGGICTRACRFCAVERSSRGEGPDPGEPERLGTAAAELGLRYVVITSVDRDDLADRGARHFALCVRSVAAACPGAGIEVLAPDYSGGELAAVLDAGLDVYAHNIETVRRLQGLRDRRASYEASLRSLSEAASHAKEHGGRPAVKSSILLGLGESRDEVFAAMDELREAGCGSLVIGQYLRPTPAQVEVAEYVAPEAFASYAEAARERGFSAVVSSPLARTSYHARSSFEGKDAAP